MKAYLITFLVLTMVLTACGESTPNPPEGRDEIPQESVDAMDSIIQADVDKETQSYDFLGVLFQYPEELIVSTLSWNDSYLLIGNSDLSNFEGDGTFMITTATMIIESISLDDKIDSMADLPAFQKSSYTNEEGYIFTKVSYYSEFGGFTSVSYFMTVEGGLLMLAQGYSLDEDELAQKIEDFNLILESIHIKELQ